MKWMEENGIALIELAHGDCNEIGMEMLSFLESCAEKLTRTTYKSLIIYSSLEKGFCAGADLKSLYQGLEKNPDPAYQHKTIKDFLDRIHKVFNTIDTLPIPVIVQTHGICFGGGFELALLGDLIIAEQSTRFCFPELRLGLIPGFGGTVRLKRDLSDQKIRDLLFTGRSIQAKNLPQIVSQVVPNQRGLAIAKKTAIQISKFDPLVIAQAKGFIKEVDFDKLEDEKKIFLEMIIKPNVLKSLKHFVEDTSAQPYLP